MKRYYAKSDVSFNVLLDGKRKHIRFDSLSTGGSEYHCADQNVCAQIEKGRGFGRLYLLDSRTALKTARQTPPTDTGNGCPSGASESGPAATVQRWNDGMPTNGAAEGPGTGTGDGTEKEQAAATPVPEVSTLSEAKEYLKERGVEGRILKNKAAILAAAGELGITFPNLA